MASDPESATASANASAEAENSTQSAPQLPPDLAAVVDAWPALPQPIRAAIAALISSAIAGATKT